MKDERPSVRIGAPAARATCCVTRASPSGLLGWPPAALRGGIRATRIERDRDGQPELEVHGSVSNLDAGARTFTLTISSAPGASSYSVTLGAGAMLPVGIANGSPVEVESTTAPVAGTNAIVASSVKLDDDLGGRQHEAEIEGVVTTGVSSSFVVNGRTVTNSAATRRSGGAPADLVPGAEVEAEGMLDARGGLAARRVSFRDNVQLQGLPTVVGTPRDAQNGSFTMFNGAFTVRVSSAAEIAGGLALDRPGFGAQPVEVRGRRSAALAGEIIATEVRPASSRDAARMIVQGPVSDVNAGARTFKVLVLTVSAAGASFRGHDDSALTPDAFFSGVDGRVVKARGTTALSGTTLTADEVELEDD